MTTRRTILRLGVAALAAAGKATRAAAPAVPVMTGDYPLRDPVVSPFAPDSLWHTPLARGARLRSTDAFTALVGAPGDPIGVGAVGEPGVENVRTGPEDDAIVVALPPHPDPSTLDGVDAGDLAAARAGHPDSPAVEQVALRGGAVIGALWPKRAPGWAGHPESAAMSPGIAYFHPAEPDPELRAVPGLRWTGFLVDRFWVKSNRPPEKMTADERAALAVRWEGDPDSEAWFPDRSLRGNACTAFVTEHPLPGVGTVVLQTLAVERPEPGADVWAWGTRTGHPAMAPNATAAMSPAEARAGLRGYMSLFVGARSLELWPGAGAAPFGMRPPARATHQGSPLPATLHDPSRHGRHGGGGLSSIGCAVRTEELCAPGEAVDTIRHPLGLNMFSGFLGFDAAALPRGVTAEDIRSLNPYERGDDPAARLRRENDAPGRVWPAVAFDAAAAATTRDQRATGRYDGADPEVKMGSLLCLPSAELHPPGVEPFDIDGLETLPARRIAWALARFGGYVVDTVGFAGPDRRLAQHHFLISCVERHLPHAPDPHQDMHRAFWRRFGWAMRCTRNEDSDPRPGDARFAPDRAAQAAWRADIVRIMRRLCLVTSNGPLTPGGGEGPRVVAHRPAPVSLLGGLFRRDGVPAPFAELVLLRDGRPPIPLPRDVFGAAHVNRAAPQDLAAGAVVWGDLDRGWHRVADRRGRMTPPIWVELGRARFGDWSLA